MDDSISRRMAIDEIRKCRFVVDAIEKINDLPSVQPEIIRCKDCKHLFDDNKCPLRTWWTHTEDDYCSYGERREDDNK